MVCHCLIVETNDGLVLVDTGLGLDDITARGARLGSGFMAFARPVCQPEETALRQVERLGFRRGDVRHVVPTHLDLDHAGGLPDFPDATVHIFHLEHDAAMRRRTAPERWRYIPAHWEHGPKWDILSPGGDKWHGFESVRAVAGVGVDVLLIPLHGHTRGHCAVAVQTDDGWLLHAGDGYFHHREIDPISPSCPPALAFFQKHAAVDDELRRANQDRLRELARDRARDVHILSAHCPFEFERYTMRAVRKEELRARKGQVAATPA